MRNGIRPLVVTALLIAAAMHPAPIQAAVAVPAVPPIGMICSNGTVTAPSTRTFDLVAEAGDVDTPDGNSIFMWSYGVDGGHFQTPGPVLCAGQGETVVIHLRNTLPEPSSIVFPGQDGPLTTTGGSPGLLTAEAATGGTVTYSFPVLNPGTYRYESGSDIAKQVEMGLYGGLIVRPTVGAGFAYDASSAFDPSREYLLLLAEIDPDLHHAVETGAPYDLNGLNNRYFTVNGREFPDTIQDNGSSLLPNQPYGALVRIQPNTAANSLPAIIRMINVGESNHPFHPHGNHTTQIAQDGRQLAPTEHFGETIGAGQTEDFLLRWDDVDQWSPSNPLPEGQPNYRNLFFKDGNTWYGGAPYLGYKGTLPVGTVSQNVCGEWYFPWHSHALNEFTNFDQGFGGMATLLRVDPAGGCSAAPASAAILGGTLKSGTSSALAAQDSTYYQVNPKTTTRTSATTAAQPTITVASAAGFPASGAYYIRIDNETMRVAGGQGTTTWSVVRGQLGTTATTHVNGATVTALQTDWYAGFTGVPAGSKNLTVTYTGRTCGVTTAAACPSIPATPAANAPQQTVKICNWTVGGAAGCATATSVGWQSLPAPPAQPRAVGSTDITSIWSVLPASAPTAFIGTGANRGQVRVLVHTERSTGTTSTPFSTWGDLMKIVYDAP